MEFKTAVLIVVALGLFATALSVHRARRKRYAASASGGLLAVLLFSAAGVLSLGALNLRTYDRLTHEAQVAELEFSQKSPGTFNLTLDLQDGHQRVYTLQGDEWQLDARVIKWKGFLNVMGVDALYRLERISGRYRNLEQERTQPHSVYELSTRAGPDLWAFARSHPRWLPWVDAEYGSATYLPMQDGARYQVSMTQSGLAARPLNDAANRAVREWSGTPASPAPSAPAPARAHEPLPEFGPDDPEGRQWL